MPYVKRSPAGDILSLHRDAVAGTEPLSADHPEVAAFLDRDSKDLAFSSMDADLIRVIEDLVDALIKRNVLCVTDLPAEAQQKLFTRRNFRDRFRGNALHLFGDELNDKGQQKRPAKMSPSGDKKGQGAPLPNSLRLL